MRSERMEEKDTAGERPHLESLESFVEHLLAMPETGDDADFDRDRSGPRPFEF